jgi:hypothetical protein
MATQTKEAPKSNMKAQVKTLPDKATDTATEVEGKKGRVMTDKKLFDMGIVGKVLIVLRKGMNLAKQHSFKHTSWANREGDTVGGTWYAKIRLASEDKPAGAFVQLKETDEKFLEIRAAAKAAKDDIFARKYTKEVGEMLQLVIDLRGESAGQSVDILKDIEL